MAKQIAFTPPPLTPKPEFRNRFPAMTEKRAESLIAACELLEVARRHEFIDLLQGLIGAKTILIEEVAEYASKPAFISAFRNLVIFAKIFAELDGQLISNLAKQMKNGLPRSGVADTPPSVWQLTKQIDHPDVRRGLSVILQFTEALGRASGTVPATGDNAHDHTSS